MKGTLKWIKENFDKIEYHEQGRAFGESLELKDGKAIKLWAFEEYDASGGLGCEYSWAFLALTDDLEPNHHGTYDHKLLYLPRGYALTPSARKYLVALAAERLELFHKKRDAFDKSTLEDLMVAKQATLESFLSSTI